MKLCSQNGAKFANGDNFMLNISIAISHIVLSLLVFVIPIICIHHLCSITDYISETVYFLRTKNVFSYFGISGTKNL